MNQETLELANGGTEIADEQVAFKALCRRTFYLVQASGHRLRKVYNAVTEPSTVCETTSQPVLFGEVDGTDCSLSFTITHLPGIRERLGNQPPKILGLRVSLQTVDPLSKYQRQEVAAVTPPQETNGGSDKLPPAYEIMSGCLKLAEVRIIEQETSPALKAALSELLAGFMPAPSPAPESPTLN